MPYDDTHLDLLSVGISFYAFMEKSMARIL
jgi:hypothetical protein